MKASYTESQIENALKDIGAIQSALLSARRHREGTHEVQAVKTQVWYLSVSMVLSLILFVVEIFTNSSLTIMALEANHEYKTYSLMLVAFFLSVATLHLYLSIFWSAKKENEKLSFYIQRNFSAFNQMIHCSDLLMKFLIFSTVFWYHPSWMAPLLFLFTGDYLIHGRLFSYPAKISITLGWIFLLAGVFQFFLSSPELFYPLAGFVIAVAGSLTYLISKLKGINIGSN